MLSQPTDCLRYGLYEALFESSGVYDNPYRQVHAEAVLTAPDRRVLRLPLFWDGENRWRLRFSPDQVGTWCYWVESSEEGLAGQRRVFHCQPSELHGGLVPMDGYPSHLARQDGTPVWLMGDTNWRAFANDPSKGLDEQRFGHYVATRAAQGFNYVHADLMSGGGLDGGQSVFLDWAGERLNLEVWQRIDARIHEMNAVGLTCGLVLAWSRGKESWASFPDDKARLRYARYVVARYSALDVVFIVAGEWDLAGRAHRERYVRLGHAIRAADPHKRPIAVHAGVARSTEEFATEPWITFGDYQQMYRAPHDREATPIERLSLHNHLLKARVHGKPVVNAEYAYYLRDMSRDRSYHARDIPGVDKPHSHTRQSFRRASWALAMAGGYFVSGFGSTYFGGWRHDGPFDVDDIRNDPAEDDLTRLASFFRNLPWWRLAPMDGLLRYTQQAWDIV